jgi:hypothetical protein
VVGRLGVSRFKERLATTATTDNFTLQQGAVPHDVAKVVQREDFGVNETKTGARAKLLSKQDRGGRSRTIRGIEYTAYTSFNTVTPGEGDGDGSPSAPPFR